MNEQKIIEVFLDEIKNEQFDCINWLTKKFKKYCRKHSIDPQSTFSQLVEKHRFITDVDYNAVYGNLLNRYAMDYMSFNYFIDLVNDDNDVLLKSSYRYINHALDETRYVNDFDLVGDEIYNLSDFDFYPTTERLIFERILLNMLKNYVKENNVNLQKVDCLYE